MAAASREAIGTALTGLRTSAATPAEEIAAGDPVDEEGSLFSGVILFSADFPLVEEAEGVEVEKKLL